MILKSISKSSITGDMIYKSNLKSGKIFKFFIYIIDFKSFVMEFHEQMIEIKIQVILHRF